MIQLSLDLFKKHVNADDFSGDDELLRHYLDTATEAIITETNRTDENLTDIGGGRWPLALVQAAMLLAGHWYNQREDVSAVQMHEIPCGVQALVKPYVRLVEEAYD